MVMVKGWVSSHCLNAALWSKVPCSLDLTTDYANRLTGHTHTHTLQTQRLLQRSTVHIVLTSSSLASAMLSSPSPTSVRACPNSVSPKSCLMILSPSDRSAWGYAAPFLILNLRRASETLTGVNHYTHTVCMYRKAGIFRRCKFSYKLPSLILRTLKISRLTYWLLHIYNFVVLIFGWCSALRNIRKFPPYKNYPLYTYLNVTIIDR